MQVVHQPALFYRQNLVEGSRDVETDGRHILGSPSLGGGRGEVFQFFICQPSFVGAAEVEFVAVFLGLHATQDGTKLRQFHLADAVKLVIDLLLLELQLLLVRQVLPLAAAAHAEVLAEGCRAYLTIFYKLHHFAFGKRVLLALYLHVADVARHAEGHKHHQVVPVEQAFALGSHGLDGDTL